MTGSHGDRHVANQLTFIDVTCAATSPPYGLVMYRKPYYANEQWLLSITNSISYQPPLCCTHTRNASPQTAWSSEYPQLLPACHHMDYSFVLMERLATQQRINVLHIVRFTRVTREITGIYKTLQSADNRPSLRVIVWLYRPSL